MIKKTVQFVDFEGKPQTEVFWFNLTRAEITEWEYSSSEGAMTDLLKRLSENMDTTKVFPIFKDILRRSFGIRDGKYFRKNEQIANDFVAHPAFSDIVIDLLKNASSAAKFFAGIMPGDTVTEDAIMSAMQTAIPFEDSRAAELAPGLAANNVFDLKLPEPVQIVPEEPTFQSSPLQERHLGTTLRKLQPGEGYTDEEIVNMTSDQLKLAMNDPDGFRRQASDGTVR